MARDNNGYFGVFDVTPEMLTGISTLIAFSGLLFQNVPDNVTKVKLYSGLEIG